MKKKRIKMGRLRKDDDEKSITYTISIKKRLLDELKNHGSPSKIITDLVKKYLDEKKM